MFTGHHTASWVWAVFYLAETGIKRPEAGFIKLEDTVIVTESGWEAYGDWGRDWNEVQL
jgi:hypothetical protein